MTRRDRKGGEPEAEDQGLSYLAQAALGRARPSRVIDFPGLEGVKVALVCPSEEERTEADVESRLYLTRTMKLTALDLTLAQETELAQREREIELLALVLRRPDDVDEVAVESADELRRMIGDHQRRALIAEMKSFERQRFEARTPEESEEVVRLVLSLKAVGGLSAFWTSCDGDTPRATRIVEALCEEIERRTEPSSSAP